MNLKCGGNRSTNPTGQVSKAVLKLRELGPNLAFPLSSGVNRSRHAQMRELRVQAQGRPFRILYAFDPGRVAILLIGGDKTGDARCYEVFVPLADGLYDQHLIEFKKERHLQMAKKFEELLKKMSPERRPRIQREHEREMAEMPLQQLRAARELTQQQMAKLLEVNQSEVSRIEKRTDMYLSTLASYIHAMGGNLEIRAVFALGESVRITQFESLNEREKVTGA
jgi:DNA-binding XRE family transcriptional regulator